MISWIVFFVVISLLSFFQVPLFTWLLVIIFHLLYQQVHFVFIMICVVGFVICGFSSLRRFILTQPIMWLIQKLKLIPKISQTEQEALEVGDTWVEKEFFSGCSRLNHLTQSTYPQLTQEEEKFLHHQTKELCNQIDDWEIYTRRSIPESIIQFIKQNKFLGMTIPKEYGGLGFSPFAHSKVLEKVCSCSHAVGVFMMVPNSLGPSQLLAQYGTNRQKTRYLPRLAIGEEIPCFALTETMAGSDASSIQSKGELFKSKGGQLKIRLNWDKRWVTLGSVSTLIGVVFRLEDPNEFLGRGKLVGITCALVSSKEAGVTRNQRHDPMTIPFSNSPIQGIDVVIDAEESIIGGLDQAGRGWKMIMDCLRKGRGISLSSLSLATSKKVVRLAIQHSVVRQQFGVSIGKFEGVREVLSRMAGLVYLSQSVLNYTISAFQKNISSVFCSLSTKYQLTEWARCVVNGGMDVMGGKALSMGPRNLISLSYLGMPIAMTVEGSNILTRSFMIFNQSLIRSHPYLFSEIQAIKRNDLKKFDHCFWLHIGQFIKNMIQLMVLSFTRGLVMIVPYWRSSSLRSWQKLRWATCLFSVLSDVTLFTLGGKLKRKETITGDLADVLMNLYTITSILWNQHHHIKKELKIFDQWGLVYSFSQIQKSFEKICYNFPHPILGFFFRMIFYPLLRLNPISTIPSDRLSNQLACSLLNQPHVLDDLLQKTDGSVSYQKQLERAYLLSVQCNSIERKIRNAIHQGKIISDQPKDMYKEALQKEMIHQQEYHHLLELLQLRRDCMQVDSFSYEDYVNFYQSR